MPAGSPVLSPLTVSCWSVTLLAPVISMPTGLPVIVATLVFVAVRSHGLVDGVVDHPPSMLMLLSAPVRLSAPSAYVEPPDAAATATTERPADCAATTAAATVAFGADDVRPLFVLLPVGDTNTVLVGFSSMKKVDVDGVDCVPEVSVVMTVSM